MTETSYIELNNRCENALNEFNNQDMETWLHRSSRLYKAISIQPEGLPSIANANFEGFNYKFISEFHNAYKQRLNKSKQDEL